MGDSCYLRPDWPAPANVHSVISTRLGGASKSPYLSNNLALHVGDQLESVQYNRLAFVDDNQLSGCIWLNQTHSVDVVCAEHASDVKEADACIASSSAKTCVVMTADCLPLLVCDRLGTQVAAIHAGWRVLANGIVANVIKAFRAKPEDLLVYLGPAISQKHFEVGSEVKQRFMSLEAELQASIPAQAFRSNTNRQGHYFADLYSLAQWQLNALGVRAVYGGEYCTFSQDHLFYSYRRDGVCGRMASAICLV